VHQVPPFEEHQQLDRRIPLLLLCRHDGHLGVAARAPATRGIRARAGPSAYRILASGSGRNGSRPRARAGSRRMEPCCPRVAAMPLKRPHVAGPLRCRNRRKTATSVTKPAPGIGRTRDTHRGVAYASRRFCTLSRAPCYRRHPRSDLGGSRSPATGELTLAFTRLGKRARPGWTFAGSAMTASSASTRSSSPAVARCPR
jgi:hypothetical protein